MGKIKDNVTWSADYYYHQNPTAHGHMKTHTLPRALDKK